MNSIEHSPADEVASGRRIKVLRRTAACALAVVVATVATLYFLSVPADSSAWGNLSVAEATQIIRDSAQRKGPLPDYVIESPDVLTIDLIKAVPKASYPLLTGDSLQVRALRPEFNRECVIDDQGMLSLGPQYNPIKIAGLTLAEALDVVKNRLAETTQEPEITLTLKRDVLRRPLRGEKLVRPDGTVDLGIHGTVAVQGMTVAQARAAVEGQLSALLGEAMVAIEIRAFNSKSYEVISEGTDFDDSIIRVPYRGSETVVDALASFNGLQSLADKNIWIARPMPGDVNCQQILPVEYFEISNGFSASNYPLQPGDRIYVALPSTFAFRFSLWFDSTWDSFCDTLTWSD